MSCIQRILDVKGNNSFLLIEDGGCRDIAVEGGGHYQGHEYLITFTDHGTRCGYVALPHNHPCSSVNDYWDLDIECHGGLTFFNTSHRVKKALGMLCNDVWIGFDAAHSHDLPDLNKIGEYFGHDKKEERKKWMLDFHDMTVKDFKYMENECKKIIDQIIVLEQGKANGC